jgi:hypothetical protein
MPSQASDQQIANETILIEFHLIDFAYIDLNAYRETKLENTKLCAILQEYEHTIRIPAQVLRQTMLDRLSVASRASLSTSIAPSIYAHPHDMAAVDSIGDDLRAVLNAFEKERAIEAKDSTEQWIVPLIKKAVRPLPYTEAETQPSQTFSTPDGYTAEVRWISATSPQSLSLLFVIKSLVPHKTHKKVRLRFDRPLGGMYMHVASGATIGYDYIDFDAQPAPLESTVELDTFGGGEPRIISVKGLTH